jgi:misacylated tRNA(Ala) deacylase
MAATQALFLEDAYLAEADATVLAVNQEGGIILDRTIFYATSGGQPGDTGSLTREDGSVVPITTTITGATKQDIIHVPGGGAPALAVGDKVHLVIDMERRLKLMRMHTACHLLTTFCQFPVTGAAVSETDSRVDFDMQGATITKEEATEKLMALVRADHPVFIRMIGENELAANPGLVKSKNVRPPTGTGEIRLVCIGEDAMVDSQPCGGTHVRSTGEIGDIHIGKIEKKGRENRRLRLRFGPLESETP